MLGISRTTVQRCYNTLRQRRLVEGHGRLGTIVQPDGARLSPGMDRLKGFTQEMQELGRQPSTGLLTMPSSATGRSPRSWSGLHVALPEAGADPLWRGHSAFLRKCLDSLEAAPFLEKADVSGSIYEQLAAHRMGLAFCDQTVEATTPSALESGIFGFTEPVPCLLIKRRSYVRRDLMIEYVEGLFRGDIYTYRIRLDA